MKTYCLVIDDNNQKDYFEEYIHKILLKDNIDLVPIFIDPTDRNKYMKADHSGFDKTAVEKDCLQAIKEHNCSVVVSDYQIATKKDSFNGLDILNTITEQYPHLYIVLYSGGNIQDAIRKLHKTLSDKIPDENKRMNDEQIMDVISQIEKMSSIIELIKGKGYAEAVVKYMRCSPSILQQSFLSQFKEEYPDMVFQSCYTPFKGWKLKAIAVEIEKRNPRGGDFQQSLLSQVIAYLIDTNTDKKDE